MSVSEAEPAVGVDGNGAGPPVDAVEEQGPPAAETKKGPPPPVSKTPPPTITQLPEVPDAPFTESGEPKAAEGADEVSELDALLPEPSEEFTLSNGSKVHLRSLKMRELLKLLRIITRGGAQLLPTLRFNGTTPEQFAIQFITVVSFAIPEAEDFAVDFVRAIVEPADLQDGDSDGVKKFNQQQVEEVWFYLDNPELDDLLQVIERLVHREKNNLQSLGKRLQTMFRLAEKTGQLPKPTT